MSTPIAVQSPEKIMDPRLIASGLGLAERDELCGLLALIDASNLIDAGVGAGKNALGKLGLEVEKQGERVAKYASTHKASARSDDELRHILLLRLMRDLDLGVSFPLSERKTAETAAALGVMASRAISPALHLEAKRRSDQEAGEAVAEDWNAWAKAKLKRVVALWTSAPPLPFPEVVSREIVKLMTNVDVRNGIEPDEIDADVANAMEKAGNEAMALLVAGGGWVGFAAMVNAAGFAPYILAAQASAFIPFMGGPAVVSLLAVLVNPVTIIAGLAAAGGLGGKKISSTIRRQVAARIAVLLAIRGTENPTEGMFCLVDSLRNVTRPSASDLAYLRPKERRNLRQRVARIEGRLGRALPKAAGLPPGDLKNPLLPSNKRGQLGEVAAVAGLTAGEMLYRAATIDDRVIQAADFWRAADLSNPFAFAAHASELQAAGSDVALRGYVAEHLVMGQLIADGHDVSLPPAANQPGYDLLVNGQPVQVKCGENPDLLREHFATYPDIPVIANVELAKSASSEPWSDMVTTLEGFELETIEAIRDEALDAGLDLAANDVFATALGVGAVRGAVAVLRGEIPARDLPAWLVVDAALKLPIVGLGGKVGGMVGLIAIGPAGALVLAPVAGAAAIFGVGAAKKAFDRIANRPWHEALNVEGEALHTALVTALTARVIRVHDRTSRLNAACAELAPDTREWIDLRACEDSIYAIEILEDLAPQPQTPTDAMSLLVEASRLAPADPTVLRLSAVLKRRLEQRPGPLDGVVGVWRDLKKRAPQKKPQEP